MKDHPEYAKYFKMVKMGVPAQAVGTLYKLNPVSPIA
jgi:hypothetical protein